MDIFSVLLVYWEPPSRNSTHILIIKVDQDTLQNISFQQHYFTLTPLALIWFAFISICLCVDIMLIEYLFKFENNLVSVILLQKTQNNIILYSLGYYWPNLQWRLYLMNLWWLITIVIARLRNNNISLGLHQLQNTFRISFEVTIFNIVVIKNIVKDISVKKINYST